MTDTVTIPRQIAVLMLSLVGLCACCFYDVDAQKRIILALEKALRDQPPKG